jgi:hypothetical protein
MTDRRTVQEAEPMFPPCCPATSARGTRCCRPRTLRLRSVLNLPSTWSATKAEQTLCAYANGNGKSDSRHPLANHSADFPVDYTNPMRAVQRHDGFSDIEQYPSKRKVLAGKNATHRPRKDCIGYVDYWKASRFCRHYACRNDCAERDVAAALNQDAPLAKRSIGREPPHSASGWRKSSTSCPRRRRRRRKPCRHDVRHAINKTYATQ